jgi:hypothetical protein
MFFMKCVLHNHFVRQTYGYSETIATDPMTFDISQTQLRHTMIALVVVAVHVTAPTRVARVSLDFMV